LCLKSTTTTQMSCLASIFVNGDDIIDLIYKKATTLHSEITTQHSIAWATIICALILATLVALLITRGASPVSFLFYTSQITPHIITNTLLYSLTGRSASPTLTDYSVTVGVPVNKKEAILEAATELFAENGYDGSSTAQIAKRAGVAHGTLFHHFGNKENLLAQIGIETIERLSQEHQGLDFSCLNGWEALEKSIRFHLNFFYSNFQAIYALNRETHRLLSDGSPYNAKERLKLALGEITAARRELMLRGKSDGSIGQQCDIDETILLLSSLISGIVHNSIKGLIDKGNITQAAINFCARSLKA
jgi:AcrR family transcriptional regulator